MIKANFSQDKGTLLISIDRSDFNIPESVAKFAKSSGFSIKSEFHITIIGFKYGESVKKAIQKSGKQSELDSLIANTSWSFIEEPVVFHIQKDYVFKKGSEHREAIIEMIYMKEAEEFYKKLNEILEIKIEEPPLHISLYTKGNPMGIGVNSFDELGDLKPKQLPL